MKINKFLITGLIVLFIILLLTHQNDYGTHPKILWTYWDNPDTIPNTVTMCMESWAKYNPNYKIILLTKTNYKNYVTIPDSIVTNPNFNDNKTRFADLVRVYTLAEHGGVWVDSSILLKEPLDTWLFPRPAEFSGFYIASFTKDTLPPVIENWFFACNKGSEFVRRWRDEFSQLAKYPSVEKYVESRKDMGVDYEKINEPIYLAMHVSAQKILQIDNYPQDRLILKKAEDGPFKYLSENKWDSEKSLTFACKYRHYQGPIMKMRGCERGVLEKRLESDLSSKHCGWLD